METVQPIEIRDAVSGTCRVPVLPGGNPDDTELAILSRLWKLRLRDVTGPPRGLLGRPWLSPAAWSVRRLAGRMGVRG